MSPTTVNNGTAEGTTETTEAKVEAIMAAARARATPSLLARTTKILSHHNAMAILALLLSGLASVNGLKCYMCGQYNEGVGSITPCNNYSDQYAHLFLKECSKKSEKFCVKYVSELSTVRDCATECIEKEIWETQTYCCDKEGCNSSSHFELSTMLLMLPLIYFVFSLLVNSFKERR